MKILLATSGATRRAIACLSVLACLLPGCAVGPDYVRPELTLPDSYLEKGVVASDSASSSGEVKRQALQLGEKIPEQWWELFHSTALNELVKASLAHNPNITAAQAALRQAQQNVAAQQGAYYPSVVAQFNPIRQKVAGTLATPVSNNAYYYSLYTAQLSVSYTPDVFGLNRRQVESLQAQADSQRFTLEASLLTLSSNVVSAAITEAALRGQIKATQEIIASQVHLLDILKRELVLGQAAEADVAAQQAALAAARASLPPLQKQLALQRDLLAALAGRYPSEHLDAQFELEDLQLPDHLPVNLPSTLVESRPDIRAAEEQLHSASAAIGVAIANRLPNVTLGVDGYGSAAYTLGNLFHAGTGFWAVGADIAQPVFDGGILAHRQDAAQAAYDEAAAQYRATVINAFQNVADSLQALDLDTAGLIAARDAEQAALKSLTITRRQLELGDTSIALLLGAEQAYQQARLNLVSAQANRLTDTAALFQALGGGWWNRDQTLAATP